MVRTPNTQRKYSVPVDISAYTQSVRASPSPKSNHGKGGCHRECGFLGPFGMMWDFQAGPARINSSFIHWFFFLKNWNPFIFDSLVRTSLHAWILNVKRTWGCLSSSKWVCMQKWYFSKYHTHTDPYQTRGGLIFPSIEPSMEKGDTRGPGTSELSAGPPSSQGEHRAGGMWCQALSQSVHGLKYVDSVSSQPLSWPHSSPLVPFSALL